MAAIAETRSSQTNRTVASARSEYNSTLIRSSFMAVRFEREDPSQAESFLLGPFYSRRHLGKKNDVEVKL